MNALLALTLSLLLATLAAPGVAASGAVPCAEGEPCETLNRACEKVFGNGCIPASADAESGLAACAGEVCDAINAVCNRLFRIDCVA